MTLRILILINALSVASHSMNNYFEANLSSTNDEIANRQSDHRLISYTLPLGGSRGADRIRILSYNTWSRGSLSGFDDVYPGYTKRVEPNADMRVKINLELIQIELRANPNSIACLQEWSDDDIQMFYSLDENLRFSCKHIEGTRFNNCIIYDMTVFEETNHHRVNLDGLNLLATTKNSREKQVNRYQHVQLMHLASLQSVDIVNVHLRWQSNASDIITAVEDLFDSCSGTCVVAGDFNQDLRGQSIAKASLVIASNGSVSSHHGQQRFNTTDAIIYRLNDFVDVERVMEMRIEPNLRELGVEFFQHLQPYLLIDIANTDWNNQHQELERWGSL